MGNSSSIILVAHKSVKVFVSMKLFALLRQECSRYNGHGTEGLGGLCSLFDHLKIKCPGSSWIFFCLLHIKLCLPKYS